MGGLKKWHKVGTWNNHQCPAFLGFCLKLDDGLIIETHHTFISLALQQVKQPTFSEPLVSEISDRIKHYALLGIPTQNETLLLEQQELLSWHYHLGHMSFQSLQNLAKLRLIPQHLSKVNPAPLCSSCTFATSKKCA